MQDMLTENVDIQAHQISEIHDTIMGATENVREGNEQVRFYLHCVLNLNNSLITFNVVPYPSLILYHK